MHYVIGNELGGVGGGCLGCFERILLSDCWKNYFAHFAVRPHCSPAPVVRRSGIGAGHPRGDYLVGERDYMVGS